MRRTIGIITVLSAVLWAAPAQATTILSGTIGGVNFCAADNNVGCGFGVVLFDTDPTVGELLLAGATIGGLDVQGSLHTSTIGTQNVLNSSSLQITNTTNAAIQALVAISATGFLGPITAASVSGSGTWENAPGSTIQYRYYVDPANNQGADTPADTPGVLLSTFNDLAGAGVDSFSHNAGPFAIIAPNPFSMTLAFDVLLAGSPIGGPDARLVSRGQTIIADQVAVPEPASLTLFGLGLAGLVARWRRRPRP